MYFFSHHKARERQLEAQILSICLEGHVLPTVESKWNLELSRNEDPFEHTSSTERGSLSLVWLGRRKGMAPGNS